MKFRSAAIWSLVVAFSFLPTGCIFSPQGGGTTPPPDYLPDTSPENVIHNIGALYIRRDVQKYDDTLGQDYVFRFQPIDIGPSQPDSLLRSEEILFAEHLFQTGKPEEDLQPASRISLVITTTSSGPDPRIGHFGWKKYVVQTQLTLTFPNGNQNNVNSPAWFYFKQEPDSSGHWKLAEWADQPSGSAAPMLATAR